MSRFSVRHRLNPSRFSSVGRTARTLLNSLLWATLFSPTLGCVVPVAPEFKDPPKSENLPPYFVRGMPLFESSTVAPEEFSIVVTDPNPFDKVWVRWVSDYPIYSPVKSKLLDQVVATRDATITYRVKSCEDFLMGTPSPHRLVVVAADREFKPFEQSDSVDYPYNSTTDKGFWIMAGWLVACP
jgi:hypothetical protein